MPLASLPTQLQWLPGDGPDSGIIIASKAVLTRNLADLPFPARCTEFEKRSIEERVLRALDGANGFRRDHYFPVEEGEPLEVCRWIERELADPALLEGEGSRGVLIDEASSMGLSLNGTDHLSISRLMPGNQPLEAWSHLDKLDDLLSERLDYAFDETLGYLTSSLATVGTALRIGVWLHLPGLAMTSLLMNVEHEMSQLHHRLEGLFGTLGESEGDLAVLSNDSTLGRSEDETVFHLRQAIRDVLTQEHAARQTLITDSKTAIEDRIGRALGIAQGVCLLEFDEALALLSSIRLGVVAHLIEGYSITNLNALLVASQPAHLRLAHNLTDDPLALSMARADLFRAYFKESVA